MIKLFKYEGYKVVISEEALLLKPFKKLWNRDKSKNKEMALSELGYVYFFADPRSMYQDIYDDEERENAIKEGEGLPDKWYPDKDVAEAIDFYKQFSPVSYKLIEDMKFVAEKLRKHLREIDFNERDDKGRPVHTVSTITETINKIPKLIESLENAERKLAQELAESGRMRGGGEKTIFEDGFE